MTSKNGLLSIMLVVFFLAVSHVFGNALPEYPCYRLASAPVMDGNADDVAWQKLPEAGGFFILGGKDYAIEKQTFFRAGWTDDSLYLCVKCIEPLPEKMIATAVDGDALWADDAVEMFFQPAGGPNYFQLIANSVGARWNSIGPDIQETKPWNWEVRAGKWEKGWLLKVRIPFSVLEKTPKAGDKWPVNIARSITTTGPAVEHYTCWPPLKKGYNDQERFGRFLFSAESPSERQSDKDEAQLNAPFYQYLKEQCALKIKDAEKAELAEALNNPALAEEAKPIKEVLGQLKALAGGSDADPSDMIVMLTTWRNLMECLSEKAKKLDIPLVKIHRLNLAVEIKARHAKDVKLLVNGQPVNPQDNKWPISLKEGLNVIAMKAKADGQNPGLRLRVPGQPELENRWRVGNASNDSWLAGTFDDRSWKKPELDKEGYLLMPQGSAGDVCLRQIVLWGENYYSGLPCLQPKVREWGFSEHSMETLFHALYSPPPLAYALEDYEFVLDVPKGFSLLDEKYPDDPAGWAVKGGKLNRRPQKVTTEEVKHESQPYTRYRFAFESASVQTNKLQCALIPLLLKEYKGNDKTCKFYFRRLASGNLTELEQTLPVRVLPPINGRMLKKVLISQYCGVAWLIWAGEGGGRLFPDHLNAHIRQSLDAGFNCWPIGAWMGEYGKKFYDKAVERGGVVVLSYNNYPLHGTRVSLGTNCALDKLMQTVPETRARFFNESDKWTKEGQYCPSFVTGEGATQFREAVKKDIGAMLHGGPGTGFIGLPKAAIYWADWEEVPWKDAGMGYEPARTGNGSYCFCERCKKAFRQYARLPDTTDLSDDCIWKNYRLEWSSFRYELDGRINGLVREACNELGLQYMVYTGTHDKQFWTVCKGKIDAAFPGCPGDGLANAEHQKYTDEVMTFFREKAGLPWILGQFFASSYGSGLPWSNWKVGAAEDGFIHPKSLKPQILRIAATFHGGVDLNCSLERCAGSLYYIGEATRIISEYEDLFWSGERADQLAASEQIKYPNLLVLRKGNERLVLLFNEGPQPIQVILENRELAPGQKAEIAGLKQVFERPEKMEISVEPEDVAVVHIQ